MDRSKKHLLRNLTAAMLLCTGFASCNTEDMPDSNIPLPDGQYPLQLSAEVEGMRSRAAGKDAWADGDAIGVRIGENGEPGQYKLTRAGYIQEAVKPLYWQNTSSSTVTAWYPCEEKTEVNIAYQSGGYADFDFLTATETNQRYNNHVSLKFKHQMAKVKYRLVKGDGVSEGEIGSAKVCIAGYTEASFAQGELTGSSNGWVTPTSDGEVLLVPQNMADKKFIRVTIDNTINYYYTPGKEDADLKAGTYYTYTITVKKNGLDVSVNKTVEWEVGNGFNSDMEETQKYKLYFSYNEDCYENVSVSNISGGLLSANSANTYDLPVEGCVIRYKVKSNVKAPFRRDGVFLGYAQISGSKVEGYFVCNISNVSSDVSYVLDSSSAPCEGDYYYTDNTYSTILLDKNENCSGVIFHVGPGPGDNVSDYDGKLQTIHGYVLAANPAGEDRPKWCTANYQKELIGTHENPDDWCGYKNTQKIIAHAHENNVKLGEENYTHIFRATTYSKNVAPNETSGWYLGAAAQMRHAANIADKLRTPISTCGSTVQWKYWGTSTERNQTNSDGIYGIYDIETGLRSGYKSYGQNPRPILTF